MTILAYGVAGLAAAGRRLRYRAQPHAIHAVVCLSVAQSGSYVLLVAVGYQRGGAPPVFGSSVPPTTPVVDPVVQALTLTDVVVSATVTALLLALAVQIARRHGTTDPDQLTTLKG